MVFISKEEYQRWLLMLRGWERCQTIVVTILNLSIWLSKSGNLFKSPQVFWVGASCMTSYFYDSWHLETEGVCEVWWHSRQEGGLYFKGRIPEVENYSIQIGPQIFPFSVPLCVSVHKQFLVSIFLIPQNVLESWNGGKIVQLVKKGRRRRIGQKKSSQHTTIYCR